MRPPGIGTLVAGISHELDSEKVAAAVTRISAVLDPFDDASRKVVLDEMIAATAAGRHPADRIELLAQLHGLCAKRDPNHDMRAMGLDDALEYAGLMPLVVEIERRAKELVLPDPTTASNLEILVMSYAYWLSPAADVAAGELECALKGALFRNPASLERVRLKLKRFSEGDSAQAILNFGEAWLKAAFARLEVGHKLAASLCLTDIPDDVEVRAPWEAWSLVIPDGLIPSFTWHGSTMTFARAWCTGTKAVFVVTSNGNLIPLDARNIVSGVPTPRLDALANLIRGACLALSNPDDFRKENQHAPSARAASKKGRHGPPDMQQARFLLSAPVKVDLREHLVGVLSGRKGASPTVQFLVRGHWRNQAHGPKHSLRKVIWVQPFWKGPEESRILLRQHRVEDPPKES